MPTYVDSPFGPIDIDAREAQGMSNVAIFNPALKGKIVPDEAPAIVLAVDAGELLIVDGNGKLAWLDVDRIQLDWSYDFKTEKWVDADGQSLEEEAE